MSRTALLLVFGAAAVLAQPPQARIKIDTERVIGEVHPHVFGNFAEHLGRCIYGGMFEEGSPLSDQRGFRKDVMEATKTLGVSILRWPGGNFASGYHWRDGIGPRDQRPMRPDHAWGATESNRFGTHEFLDYSAAVGAEPYLCINAGLGTVDEAREWVEYVNESRPTSLALLRKKNGREKPWGVKYWGLGNEIDGPWQLGHKNANDYATFALEAAKAMRRADESIKLIASGSSNFGVDWVEWNRIVLEKLRNEIDYISLHTYIGNRENNFERYMAAGEDIDERIEVVAGQIRAVQARMQRPRPIYIAFDEWNVWYRARADGGEFAIGKTGLEEIYNYEDALAMGMFLNSFIRHADVLKMANLAQLVNVIAPIFTNKEGMFLQPIYWPLVEYGKQRGLASLDLLVSGPAYSSGRHSKIQYLDTSATYDAKSKTLYLNVLNRSERNDITARIDNATGAIRPQVEIWEMNHSNLKTTHTFGDDRKVVPSARTVTVQPANGGISHTFPKSSLTILKMHIQ